MKIKNLMLIGSITGVLASAAHADLVSLQNPTGTYSQPGLGGGYMVSETIDGEYNDVQNGWAVFNYDERGADYTQPQTAVWETALDLNAPSIELKLHQNYDPKGYESFHLIGRFRISVTGDDRGSFADGLESGGDVDAGWTILTPTSVEVPALMTWTLLDDDSILTGGKIARTGVYTVRFDLPFANVTGLRLETLDHPTLPYNGPGHHTTNGNFVLSEIELASVPEPASLALLGLGGLALVRRRR